MNRVPLILLMWAMGLGPVSAVGQSTTSPSGKLSRPNIVLMMADDMGYECFGCYGGTSYSTPNLDRLAAAGVRFDYCFSQPLCTPSRVKLMTGRSNVRNYVDFSILDRRERTIGQYLQSEGYATAVVGKWQLLGAAHYGDKAGKGTHPGAAGFDRYCLWQVEKLGSRYWRPKLEVDGKLTDFGPDQYGPDQVTRFAIDFMRAKPDQPFFLYYPMILPHGPFEPTPDSQDRQSKNKQHNFSEMVRYVDRIVGRLDRALEESGIRDNTILIFTSDNGTGRAIRSAMNGRIVKGGKGLTTDAGMHVPLVISWPGRIKQPTVVRDLVDLSDLLPTVADAVGLSLPKNAGLDGRSFYNQLCGRPGNPRTELFCYYNPRPGKPNSKAVRFAWDQRFKLYDEGRFYHWADDRTEQNPIAEPVTAAGRSARRRLQARLDSMPASSPRLLDFSAAGD